LNNCEYKWLEYILIYLSKNGYVIPSKIVKFWLKYFEGYKCQHKIKYIVGDQGKLEEINRFQCD